MTAVLRLGNLTKSGNKAVLKARLVQWLKDWEKGDADARHRYIKLVDFIVYDLIGVDNCQRIIASAFPDPNRRPVIPPQRPRTLPDTNAGTTLDMLQEQARIQAEANRRVQVLQAQSRQPVLPAHEQVQRRPVPPTVRSQMPGMPPQICAEQPAHAQFKQPVVVTPSGKSSVQFDLSMPTAQSATELPFQAVTFPPSPFYQNIKRISQPARFDMHSKGKFIATIRLDLGTQQAIQSSIPTLEYLNSSPYDVLRRDIPPAETVYSVLLFCYPQTNIKTDMQKPIRMEFPSNNIIHVNGKQVVKARWQPPASSKYSVSYPIDLTTYLIRGDHIAGPTISLDFKWDYTPKTCIMELFLSHRIPPLILYKKITEIHLLSPKESKRRFFGGSDSDEVIAQENTVSLRDPLSQAIIRMPVRGGQCSHAKCFDLWTYLTMNEQSPTWACPVCGKSSVADSTGVSIANKIVLRKVPDLQFACKVDITTQPGTKQLMVCGLMKNYLDSCHARGLTDIDTADVTDNGDLVAPKQAEAVVVRNNPTAAANKSLEVIDLTLSDEETENVPLVKRHDTFDTNPTTINLPIGQANVTARVAPTANEAPRLFAAPEISPPSFASLAAQRPPVTNVRTELMNAFVNDQPRFATSNADTYTSSVTAESVVVQPIQVNTEPVVDVSSRRSPTGAVTDSSTSSLPTTSVLAQRNVPHPPLTFMDLLVQSIRTRPASYYNDAPDSGNIDFGLTEEELDYGMEDDNGYDFDDDPYN